MILGIPHNSLPLFFGIYFISITLASIWSFRRRDSLEQLSRRLKWILSFVVYLIFPLIISLIVFLGVMLLLNYFVPDPTIRIKLFNRLGFIMIPFACFFKWLFDPWPKFIEENSKLVKEEYLYPPKSSSNAIEE